MKVYFLFEHLFVVFPNTVSTTPSVHKRVSTLVRQARIFSEKTGFDYDLVKVWNNLRLTVYYVETPSLPELPEGTEIEVITDPDGLLTMWDWVEQQPLSTFIQ